jgi:Flagellar hook-length control protein FliK
MDIQPALLSTPIPVKTPQLDLSQWLLGQTLNATVTGRKSADTLILQIQNQQIEAKTTPDKLINIGDQLKLVVTKLSNPVVLQVLQPDTSKIIHEIKQQILRENIPKQASMKKMTTVLNQVSNNVREVIKFLPAPIEQQFKKLIEHLPLKSNLNNEAGLKATIKNSGIFLESKLLTEASIIKKSPEHVSPKRLSATSATNQSQPQSITKDLKTNLLQLSDVITKYKQSTNNQDVNFVKQVQTTVLLETAKSSMTKIENTSKAIDLALKLDAETISKQIESSIARIETNQTKAIVTNDNQTPVWSVEIPVKDKQDIDLLKLSIQADSDSKSNNEQDKLWTATLKIDFENIGSVSAKLSIIDKEVNATLWSENETLSKLINDNLLILDKQIERCGLSTGNIVCLEEAPIEQNTKSSVNNLINISI